MRTYWILVAMALSGCTTVGRDGACTDRHAAKLQALGAEPSADDVAAYNRWVAAYDKEIDAYNACMK